MAGSPTKLAEWVEAFVASESQAAQVDAWVERISAPVVAQIPEIAADAVLAQTVSAGVRAHWLAFLNSVSEPPREVRLVQAAVENAEEIARRGLPLTVLFRVYRVAQGAVWENLTSVVSSMSDDNVDEANFLVFFWSRASQWLDSSIEAAVEVYQAEHTRLVQGAAAQSLEAVRGVLAGGTPDPRELSALLGGHPLSGYNTALLLHTDNADLVADLGESVTRLASAAGTKHPLVVSPGGRDLWCWFAHRSTPDLTALNDCAEWLEERGVTVAVGTPQEGVPGFRLSHLEAQQARTISFRATVSRAITQFADVELLSLLISSPEAAQRFVTRTLGGLADEGEGPARLRQTLHALLSTGSVDEASRLLTVHKNTVRYRVAQAEELLGFPAGRASTEVELALRYYDTFMG